MAFSQFSDHKKGLVLTTIGGLALSVDIPLLRLGAGEMWSVLGVRSLTTLAVALLLWLGIRLLTASRPPLMPGVAALWTALIYGLSSILFIVAVFFTTTANVVFIVAFNPMFAALLSWIFLKERPQISTLVTMGAMVVGVGVIVQGGISGGHLFGDMMAVLSALALAAALTVSRATRLDMGFVPLVATIIPALIGLCIALPQGVSIAHPFWVLFDGAVMIPLAFWCLATGPRYLSAPEVAMFYLLETILAPLWVWMIFAEVPGAHTLVGGSILVLALVGYSLWQHRMKTRLAVSAHQ